MQAYFACKQKDINEPIPLWKVQKYDKSLGFSAPKVGIILRIRFGLI